MKPRVSLIADEQLTGPARDKVQDRLDRYVAVTLTNALKPLFDLQDDAEMPGPVRGIAFRLVEALGILDRGPIADEIKGLDQDARSVLRKHGVRFGAFHVFLPLLLKPAPRKLAAQLWALNAGGAAGVSPQEIDNRLVPELVASGRTSVMRDPAIPDTVYGLLGFKPVGNGQLIYTGLEPILHGQIWRLVTPALMHGGMGHSGQALVFGLVHLGFNMWWLKDLGTIIEHLHHSWYFLVMVLVIAVVSHVLQFVMAPTSLFLGMSGVVP